MHPTTRPSAHTQKQVAILRAHALAYPETREDFPWGHSAFKVRTKAFAFLHADAEGFSISVKLPESGSLALELPFAEPTGYGLGKSGWVSARFGPKQDAPLPMLLDWLSESYAAIAPKGLVKQLAAGRTAERPAAPPTRRKPVSAAAPKRTRARAAKGAQRKPAQKRRVQTKRTAAKAPAGRASNASKRPARRA